jgi:hypothetical protein
MGPTVLDHPNQRDDYGQRDGGDDLQERVGSVRGPAIHRREDRRFQRGADKWIRKLEVVTDPPDVRQRVPVGSRVYPTARSFPSNGRALEVGLPGKIAGKAD